MFLTCQFSISHTSPSSWLLETLSVPQTWTSNASRTTAAKLRIPIVQFRNVIVAAVWDQEKLREADACSSLYVEPLLLPFPPPVLLLLLFPFLHFGSSPESPIALIALFARRSSLPLALPCLVIMKVNISRPRRDSLGAPRVSAATWAFSQRMTDGFLVYVLKYFNKTNQEDKWITVNWGIFECFMIYILSRLESQQPCRGCCICTIL